MGFSVGTNVFLQQNGSDVQVIASGPDGSALVGTFSAGSESFILAAITGQSSGVWNGIQLASGKITIS